MCRSKHDGGRRCEGHLRADVQKSVLAFADSLVPATGLTKAERCARQAEMVAAINHLMEQGATLRQPTRAEVDEWLELQAWRCRWSDEVPEPRKAALIEKLRSGVGRVRPDGATFYTWRHLAAEWWRKARRRIAAVLIAGSIATGTAACGTPGRQETHPATASPSVSVSAADSTFGADAMAVASAETQEFAQDFMANPQVATGQMTREEAIDAMPMTNAAKAKAKANPDAIMMDTIRDPSQGQQFAEYQGSAARLLHTGDFKPTMTVDTTRLGRPALRTTFDASARWYYTEKGAMKAGDIHRTYTLWLTPSTAGGATRWQIADFETTNPGSTMNAPLAVTTADQ